MVDSTVRVGASIIHGRRSIIPSEEGTDERIGLLAYYRVSNGIGLGTKRMTKSVHSKTPTLQHVYSVGTSKPSVAELHAGLDQDTK